MMTVTGILALAALIIAICSWGWNKPAIHLAVILLALIELIQLLPLK